jgi:hypothetical protein
MNPVQGMDIEKRVKQTGTPDIGDDHGFMIRDAHLYQRSIQAFGNAFMGAARAEYRGSAGI